MASIEQKITEIPLEKSPYSHHFNVLTRCGAWTLKTENSFKRNAYVLLEIFFTLVSTTMCILFYINLYVVFGDMKKTTWNLCLNLFLTWGVIKQNVTLYRCDVLHNLRRKLHRKAMSRRTPEDIQLNRRSEKQLRRIEVVFYFTVAFFIPIWITSRYFGILVERDIPVPLWLPSSVDLKDDLQFNIAFVIVTVATLRVVVFSMSMELSMFGLLIQISREYDRLIKDFRNINKLFGGGESESRECNMSIHELRPHLREKKIKKILRELAIRQQELVQYTRDFELTYRYTTLSQFSLTTVLLASIIQYIMECDRLSIHITYQTGYLGLVLFDLLFFCWFATRIRSQCYLVGEAAYSVFWYRMGIDIQKNICMIIMRSQHPPKITSGKFFEVDLHSFVIVIRNVYSCITLITQLAFKQDS